MTDTNDLYDISKYTDKELYDILDMNNPTDRELEAKLIHLIDKYDNMQNESGDKLSIFFQNIYHHFFNDEEDIEGFENQTTINPNEFAVKLKEGEINRKNNPIMNNQLTNTIIDNETNNDKTFGNEITSVQQFDYSGDNKGLNPIKKQTIKRIICIDSQYRNIKTDKLTTSFSFDLSEPLKNVVSLKLYSVQIPYTWYTIPQSYGSNFFYLKGNTVGINDGNHDYKIQIPAGNYTPFELETKINERFCDISNNTPTQMLTYDIEGLKSASDVIFNQNKIISYNSNTSKMTMNLDLQKVYTESYYNITFPTQISEYLGFTNNEYNMCSITSKISFNKTDVDPLNYTLTDDNNYFTVQLYDDVSYKVILQKSNSNMTGLFNRNDIFVALNETLKNYSINSKKIFETNSKIEIVDVSGNVHYKLTIILDRHSVKYKPNMNVRIVFPTETTDYSIWKYNAVINNCFFFENEMNDLSEIISEKNASYSSYNVNDVRIELTCKKTKYDNNYNDIIIKIPNTESITLPDLMESMTNSIYLNNTQLITFTPDINKAIINTDSKFNLTIDFEKKFTKDYYHIKWDNTSALSGWDSINNKTKSYVASSWNVDTDLSDNNIFTHVFKKSNAYYVDFSYVFTITPTTNIEGNQQDASGVKVTISLPKDKVFYYFDDYVNEINNAFSTTKVDDITVLAGSNLNYTETEDKYNLTLNIAYNYFLTEQDYNIKFIDGSGGSGGSDSDWRWSTLDISSNYEYILSSNISDNKYNSTIKGKKDIIANTLDLSNSIITIKTNVSSSQYKIPNETIELKIPSGIYTNYSICNKINSWFNNNPKLTGSNITQFGENNKIYTKLNININNIYTTKDYNIVFYDPISFAKCFNGSRSIQTTTWDSTLGWILGFRDYTQYFLTNDNLKNVGDNTIYLTSTTGKYTYDNDKNSITLEGDTTVSTNLYNYFLISLDDFIQNHLNDGLVTITRKETSLSIPNYLYKTTQECDPITKTLISKITTGVNVPTKKQLYSLNQTINSQKNKSNPFSSGPFIKDLFGLIPIKVPSKNGDYYIEFGGSLQSQERLYFGPVNIRKMAIQLLNDRGDLVDLNNTNWSFSFICEQLYSDTSSS